MNPSPSCPFVGSPGPGLLAGTPAPPPSLIEGELQTLAWILGALLLSAFFASLRSALLRSHPARVREAVRSPKRLERADGHVLPLLQRAESLEMSAAILKNACDLFFGVLLLDWLAGEGGIRGTTVVLWLLLAVPTLMLLTDVTPRALALRYGDRLLLGALPAFHLVQIPLGLFVLTLAAVRRGLLRALGVRENSPSTRHIVEGLREVIEDVAPSGDLDETEREMIENVMEFRDVDIAAVMTPRTEVHGVDVAQGIPAALRIAAECGHSRIPVYEDSLDSIIGTFSSRDLVQLAADGRLEQTDLREVIHRPYFVPETKHVSDLLAEFRREKLKVAIVLDEYGGTAGIVTLGDIVAEIVGEMQDEYDEESPEPIHRIDEHQSEVLCSLHVTEVNEGLDLDIPEEEDYETLGGYVLSCFGRFPKPGDSFVEGNTEYTVLEASDRRVLKVRIRRLSSNLGRRDAS